MRTPRKRIVIAVNENQKTDYDLKLKSGLVLRIKGGFGDDQIQNAPTLGLVVAVGEDIDDIAVGDMVLCHHITLTRYQTYDKENKGQDPYGKIHGMTWDGLSLFSVDYPLVWLKVDENGEALPLKNYSVVELIEEEKPDTFLEIVELEQRTKAVEFKMVTPGAGCDYVKPGQVFYGYKKSNVKVRYMWNMEERVCYRIENDDIQAIKETI
jgi:hypothetical protein